MVAAPSVYADRLVRDLQRLKAEGRSTVADALPVIVTAFALAQSDAGVTAQAEGSPLPAIVCIGCGKVHQPVRASNTRFCGRACRRRYHKRRWRRKGERQS